MANFVLDKAYRATGTAAFAIGDIVKFVGSTGCVKVSAANDVLAFGVVVEPVKAEHVTYGNANVTVRVLGIALARAGAAVTAGAKLAVNANGALIVKPAGAGPVVGIAMEDGASGSLVNVLLTPGAITSA